MISPQLTLRRIGYWSGPSNAGWPDAATFVDIDTDQATPRHVSEYLRAGTAYIAAAGSSRCRLCGQPNGSAELTDGKHFVWPEGLAHYVDDHNLRLPDEVIPIMSNRPKPVDVDAFLRDIDTGQVVIDNDWWRSAAGQHR